MKLAGQRSIHWLLVAVLFLLRTATLAQENRPPPASSLVKISSLADLQTAVTERGRVVVSFEIEGIVCAVLPGRSSVVLQDDSASILLELPGLDSRVQTGDRRGREE